MLIALDVLFIGLERLPAAVFVANPDSPYFTSKTFEQILDFIQTKTNKAKLKQVGKNGILIVRDMNDMSTLHHFLKQMDNNRKIKIPQKIEVS